MTIARFEHISPAQYAKDAPVDALPLTELTLPCRATAGSAGYDFISTVETVMQPGETALIPTGIRAAMEPGWVLLLFPRSSLGFKHNVRLANTVGVIDSDYYHAANEGHIMVKLYNGGDHPVTIARGERFCQGVFLPHGLAQEETVTTDRQGGFGSTGM